MPFLSKLIALFFGAASLLTNDCAALSSVFTRIPSYSQASQDQFVYSLLYDLLGKQDNGYYLEIGAGHPISGNNSYFFESSLGWKGVSIDIDSGVKKAWDSARKNLLLIEDATQSDYHWILKPFPQVIDYLSLDIDSNYDLVLRKIPFNDYIFKIITIEHDFYKHGDKYRKDEREILSSLGYYLLCPDVVIYFNGTDSIFEDWWIHPSAFPEDVLSKLTSLDLKGKRNDQLINIIRSIISR